METKAEKLAIKEKAKQDKIIADGENKEVSKTTDKLDTDRIMANADKQVQTAETAKM